MRLTQCLILVCVTIGLAGVGWSQASDTEYTPVRTKVPDIAYPVVNGRWWLRSTWDMKLGYWAAWTDSTPEPEKDVPLSATFGDMVQATNEFYSHPENRALVVTDALRIFNMKTPGVSAECVEATIEWQRFFTAGLSPQPKSTSHQFKVAADATFAKQNRLCGEPATFTTPAR